MSTTQSIRRIYLLRPEASSTTSFELELIASGQKVKVITSLDSAISLIASDTPDLIAFDPVSEFGLSDSIRALRSSFDGPIVATGISDDSNVAAMLPRLGITSLASDAKELLQVIREISGTEGVEQGSAETTPRFQLDLSTSVKEPRARMANSRPNSDNPNNYDAPKQQRNDGSHRWYLAVSGIAVLVAVVAVVALLLPRSSEEAEVAKALPTVPDLLLQPLVPLTLDELSGDTLPLEISGIKDRTLIEAAAVAFWGDTAPDAFVTVNGEPVEVSPYGAFVVDLPLEDGANFIEVLASDFQGRTTSKSFTLVRAQ